MGESCVTRRSSTRPCWKGCCCSILLWWYARRPRLRGQVAAAFLVGYGAFCFIVEFWRQPDSQLGLLSLGLSMGQWLSLPMIVAGVALWLWSRSRGITDVVVPADDEEGPEEDEALAEAAQGAIEENGEEATDETHRLSRTWSVPSVSDHVAQIFLAAISIRCRDPAMWRMTPICTASSRTSWLSIGV